MVVVEVIQLLAEARQLARQNFATYFGSPWNLMDSSASTALIIGAVGHFQRSADIVHFFGALGVALKWFSTLWGSLVSPHDPLVLPNPYSNAPNSKLVWTNWILVGAQVPWTTCGRFRPQRHWCG
jgi:hypothetical protein